MNSRRLARIAGLVWASPCSLVGVAFAAVVLAVGGRAAVTHGTIEVCLRESESSCPRIARLMPFRAITLGHVIIAIGRHELDAMRSHEQVHVRQYERWGIAFFPAYAASSLWQLVRGRRAYWDNHFEIEARRLSDDTSMDKRHPLQP